MGFWKRGLLVVLFVLPFVYGMQMSHLSQHGDARIFPGDNITFNLSGFASDPDYCEITFNQSTFNMTLVGNSFLYNITDISIENVSFACPGEQGIDYFNIFHPGFEFNLDVFDGRTGSVKTHLMESVVYNFTISNLQNVTISGSNNVRSLSNFSSCDFSMSTSHSSLSFFDEFYPFLNSTCGAYFNFSTSSLFNITSYGPQLNVSASNPFSSLTSSSGFKLGTYDFNLDYVDDLVILTDSSLLIYDGRDVADGGSLVPVYNNTAFNIPDSSSTREFFITDMNWNGYGDIIINNASGVYLLTYTSNFNFDVTPVFLSSNVASFGAFDIDGDFLKDILVVNGSEQTWQFNYFSGDSGYENVTSYTYNGASYMCDQILIFDINKNNLQDIVCRDATSSQKRIRLWTRDNLSTDLSEFNSLTFNLSYTPTDIFFTDVAGNGEWELGVRSSNNVYFYEINLDGGSLNLINNTPTKPAIFNNLFVDLLNEEGNHLMQSYFDGSISMTDFYSFPLSLMETVNYGYSFFSSTPFFLNSNADQQIIVGRRPTPMSPDNSLIIFNNSISLYRDPVFDYNVDIFLYDLAEDGIENDTTSLNVRFRFENISTYYDDTNQWNYHDYFFVVRFSDRIFRNDFFDSQQNLKYFMVDRNNEYSFNYNNVDEYSLDFALNKYSMALTNITNATKRNTECACFFEGSCNITSFCRMNDVGFNATLNISSAPVTWNNLSNVGDILLTNTVDTVTGSSFYNGSFTLVGGSDRTYTNSFFENMVVEFRDTTVILNEVNFINSTILLNNATVTFNATNGNVTLNNSVIHNYTGTFDVISSENSIIYTYEFNAVSFFDNFGDPVSISGSVVDSLQTRSFSPATSFSGWFLEDTNFTFNTEFKYFNESVVFNGSDIVLTKTHIPTWDYTLNTSHMTDFRNYSLLQNIDNLTGVKLSRPGVNITLDTANFSDMNLEEQFTFDNTRTTSITLFVNISTFNLSFVSHLLGEVVVTHNGDYNTTYNSTGDVVFFPHLEPGEYVFTQVLDRFVLGEFSTNLNSERYFLISKSGFLTGASLNTAFDLYKFPALLTSGKTSQSNLLYYSGNLHNNNTKQEIVN